MNDAIGGKTFAQQQNNGTKLVGVCGRAYYADAKQLRVYVLKTVCVRVEFFACTLVSRVLSYKISYIAITELDNER